MRIKIKIQPSFSFTISNDLKVVEDYCSKYERISLFLDKNPKILDLVHEDLKNFGSDEGRESEYSSEQVLRAIVVKLIEQEPFRDAVIQISQSDFLRNFIRTGVGPVMDFTILSRANKLISPATWQRINKLLLKAGKKSGKVTGEKLRVDSTVYESNIHYPTDASLLWDSYRVLVRLMRDCNEVEPQCSLGNRFHDSKVKKLYTYISTRSGNKSKRTKQKVKTKFSLLIDRVDDIHEAAKLYKENADSLGLIINSTVGYYIQEISHYIPLIEKVIDQSYRKVIKGEKVPAPERIFSLFEEHTELIKRGKAGKPIEFGHVVTIGQTGEKFITYYEVMKKVQYDNTRTDIVIKDHKNKFGQYPNKFAADRNYYVDMEHTRKWEKKIDVYSVAKKGGRNKEEQEREETEEFKEMQKFRAGSEGSISVLKRAFGLKRCLLKGFNSFAASLGCLVFCHNLALLARL